MPDYISCALCGKRWHPLNPGVRFIYGDGQWECADETQCFGRIAIQAAIDSASEPLHVVATEEQPEGQTDGSDCGDDRGTAPSPELFPPGSVLDSPSCSERRSNRYPQGFHSLDRKL